MYKIFRGVFLSSLLLQLVVGQIDRFSNPILDIAESEASVVKIDNFYYLAYANYTAKEIQILRYTFLTDFRNAEKGVVYKIPDGYSSYSPSSFVRYRKDLYLHFHMGNSSSSHRMFCVKAQNPKNPLGLWSAPSRPLEQVWSDSAEQGAVLNTNGQLYYVWSGPSITNGKISLHISKMKSPTEAIAPAVPLREPQEDWECYGECSLHAPAFLYHGNTIYMTFTASSPFVPETSVGYMSIKSWLNPMNSSNWESGPGPVFQGNSEENVYSTRFAQFTTSPDGTETWMLYTASSNSANLKPTSRIRIDKVEFGENDDPPKFPLARANGYQQIFPSGEPLKFLNPILDDISADPNAFLVGDSYYMVLTNDTSITILKSDKLFDFRNAEKAVIQTAPEGFYFPMASRLEEINGESYLYFCMEATNGVRQMYISRADNSSDLMHNWGTASRLLDGLFEGPAYHGTVLKHFGQNYFVWAHQDEPAVIYIALMQSPTHVTGPVVLLKQPSQPWECYYHCINDYPSFLYKDNVAFMVFAASGKREANSSISYMSIEAGRDPLDVTNWYLAPGPVFTRNDEENVFATGRASFVSTPNGLETWMLYQGSDDENNIDPNLKIRMERITWNAETGNPIFPKAHGFTHPQPIPGWFRN